ncbi:hypothetical protein ABBQ32_008846 [Trebouxia sp. C0010 RCD-2024]
MQEDDNTGGNPYNLRSQSSGRSRPTYTSGGSCCCCCRWYHWSFSALQKLCRCSNDTRTPWSSPYQHQQ